MKRIFWVLCLAIAGLASLAACSVIRIQGRAAKDQHLDATDSQRLNGTFSMGLTDSTANFYERSLWMHFSSDTLSDPYNWKVKLAALHPKALQVSIYQNDSLVDEVRVKGRFHKGYFKTRRQFRANGIAGPLLWVLTEDFKHVGLTNENNLVVLNSGGSGFLLLVAIPMFAAGGGQFSNEYERLE